MIDLKQFAELLERDEEGRKRIAKILASEIAVDAEIRELLITAVLKDDIENLRKNIKDDIEKIREDIKADIKNLKNEIRDAEKRMKEYVDIRIQAVEEKLTLLTNFVFVTFIATLITLVLVLRTI